tara:strand:- start:267 stop:590 length:324 start_codon:yes stop_codon:yes gene_type:complete
MENFNHNKLYLIDGRTLERVVESIILFLKEDSVYEKPMNALLKILLTLEEIYNIHEFDDEFDNIEANKIMNDIFNIDDDKINFKNNKGIGLEQLIKDAGLIMPKGRK